jgi:hypothetical protein
MCIPWICLYDSESYVHIKPRLKSVIGTAKPYRVVGLSQRPPGIYLQ